MKALAKRTHYLKQSEIRAVTRMVNEVDGINLGQGICDLPTPDPVKKAANEAIDANRSIYTSYAGIQPLRQAILEKAQNFNGIPCSSPEEVMVSAGSTGAFVTAAMTLLDPGDEIILFEPFYGYHRSLLDVIGVVPIVLSMQFPHWEIDVQNVSRHVSPKTKAILINTPSNPCGKVWSRSELEGLLKVAEENDLFVITDEIYEYMTYDNHTHLSFASLSGAYERTITLSGFSKTYNMTGWRLGYAVGPPPLIERMGLLNDLIYICAPTPLQYGVAAAFSMDDVYFENMMRDYTLKRQMICNTLKKIGFSFEPPDGAYYVFANFRRLSETRSGFDDDQMACRTLIEQAGVGTVAGHSFFENPEEGRFFLRFCFAKEFPELERACRNLESAFA